MEKPKKTQHVQAGEKYLIRFPEGMREHLAEVAKSNNRSMNAEIVARLERSFEGEKLGFSMDLLDAVGMQSMLLLTFRRLLDTSKMTEEEMRILDAVCGFSQRIADNTSLTNDPARQVIVTPSEDQG